MKIGNIEFGPRPVFLAPMEDVTDIGFRLLCKRFGASMVYTEFVSAEALIRDVKSTLQKLTISMLQNIPKMLEITRKVVDAVKLPVTVKTRLGWNHEQLIITELAEQLQDCGIQALTIHGRTRSQMYTGQADWTLIGEVKRNPRIHIPIIGNGDITSAEEAQQAFDTYGVDAIMIGRATFGRPWIFKEVRDYLDQNHGDRSRDSSTKNHGPVPMILDFNAKLDILIEQLRINVARIDEKRGILHTRRHLAATPIFKGIPNFRQMRIAMLRAETMDELLAILEEIRTLLTS